MVNNPSFPNAYINLQDNSAQTVADPTVLPVHLPLFLTFADKGPVGVPQIGGANALQAIFGSSMLNERSPLFTHQSVFLKRALPFQQVMMARVVDPAATFASLVLLCTVTPAQIPQYQRNSSGGLVLTNGQPTPVLQTDGVTPVTAAGVKLSFSTRALASGETISTVATVTSNVTVGGQQVTANTYPIAAFTADVGSAGNNAGFRLFYNTSYDTTAVANVGAMLWSFQPVVLNTLTNIESPIYDIYNSQTQTFAFMPNAYDPTTATFYPLTDVINDDYNGLPGLPYDFYVYGANVGTIGQAILTVSPELGAISPYLVNFMTAVDANGNPYEHMQVDSTAATILNANVVNYLSGGTDGSVTKEMYESLVVAYLSGVTYPQISDTFRYPLTHFYDSGFSLANKEAMIAFYGLRDDVKITWSTQDVALPANTAAQDQSTGSALRAWLLLNPESIDFGTQFCRADIYQQCGTLSDTQVYNTIVPCNLDRMLKRCAFNGSSTITAEPKGRPNSEVTIFNIASLNWTPTTDQQKQLSWNNGLNYIQYADVKTVFYPDLISVYPLDTSLLSNDCFVDYAAVYLKKIIRRQWTIYSGRTDPAKNLFTDIEGSVDSAANYVFNNRIGVDTVASQTAIDSALGYQITVTCNVTGNMPDRVWQTIVTINRASTSTTTSATS
jgi:hypothetical protein